MSYSIFIKDMSRSNGHPPHLLAYDVGSAEEANEIISSIARSYPQHGLDTSKSVYWFQYNNALHEIYAYGHS